MQVSMGVELGTQTWGTHQFLKGDMTWLNKWLENVAWVLLLTQEKKNERKLRVTSFVLLSQ